jgi:hypothetical protein
MGALDGLKFSNTYAYEALLGWRGVHIEASPQSYKVGEGGAATGSVPCATIGGGLGLETLGLATASSCSLDPCCSPEWWRVNERARPGRRSFQSALRCPLSGPVATSSTSVLTPCPPLAEACVQPPAPNQRPCRSMRQGPNGALPG